MSHEQEIHSAIDACRPGSDDLHQPELADLAAEIESDSSLAEVYRRVQAIDGQIAAAMDDLEVPEGLCSRLLARLEANSVVGEALTMPADSPIGQDGSELVEVAAAKTAAGQSDRRTWLTWTVAAMAASLLLAASVWLRPGQHETLTLDAVQHKLALEWHDQAGQAEAWRTKGLPFDDYPPSRRLNAVPNGWQPLRVSADRSAVAYDCTPPGSNQRVTLFVLRAALPEAANAPPSRPFFTLGRSVAVWREQGLLYVLVVEGNENRYHHLIQTKTSPLA